MKQQEQNPQPDEADRGTYTVRVVNPAPSSIPRHSNLKRSNPASFNIRTLKKKLLK